MAGIAYVRKRLFNPEVIVDTNNVLNLAYIRQNINGYKRPTYFIKWTGGTQAGEELGTAAASVKDGTTTPFQITVVSSDVADKRTTAAGAVHSVALIGISVESIAAYNEWVLNGTTTTLGEAGRPKSTIEVVAMNGTTDVTTTRYYLWVDHAYACEWGTGATDATGNITIESPANTTLITIAATYNESDGGSWHFPPDCVVRTTYVKTSPTAALAAGDGVNLTATWTNTEKTNNSDPDLNVDHYNHIHYGGQQTHATNGIARYTTKTTKCLWSEALIANTQTYDIEIMQDFHRV